MENEQRVEENVDNTDYIAAIKELKQNTVSKADYDKIKEENKNLLATLVQGGTIEADDVEEELKPRLDYYKAYKKNEFSSDLDYWINFLNLRESTIKEYGRDPLVTGMYGVDPEGNRVEADFGEAETMQELCNNIRDLIEESNGDPHVFSIKLKSAIK